MRIVPACSTSAHPPWTGSEAAEQVGRIAILHRGRLVALGTPPELTESLGRPGATLGDVFTHYSGDDLETGGGEYRAAVVERRTERQLA